MNKFLKPASKSDFKTTRWWNR